MAASVSKSPPPSLCLSSSSCAGPRRRPESWNGVAATRVAMPIPKAYIIDRRVIVMDATRKIKDCEISDGLTVQMRLSTVSRIGYGGNDVQLPI